MEKKKSKVGKKKERNFGKNKNKKKRKSWKKKWKNKKRKKERWITIVIHSYLGVGEQWFPHII